MLSPNSETDPLTKLDVNKEVVMENLHKFGVSDMVELVTEKSYPFPLKDRTFTTVFIDGDHWGMAPIRDWENARKITTERVIFDNHDDKFPAIIDACEKASGHPDWEFEYKARFSYCLRRKHD
jgi:hypothetical protein